MAITGWVLVQGNAGETVPTGTPIYTAKSMITTIRAGSIQSNSTVSKEIEDYLNDTKVQSAIQEALTTGSTSALEDAINTETGVSTTDATFTGTPISLEEAAIELQAQEQISKIDEMTERINNISFSRDSVTVITQWFDDMDTFLDSIPTTTTVETIVYEVERSETDTSVWYYTGVKEYADVNWNQSMNYRKAVICQKLNNFANFVTGKVTSWINSTSTTIGKCKIFTAIISVIQKVPSLDNIISWAKSVIEFITALYKFIYDTYVNAMAVLTVLVVRFPLLISKIVQKISQMDCPVNISTTSITIKSSSDN